MEDEEAIGSLHYKAVELGGNGSWQTGLSEMQGKDSVRRRNRFSLGFSDRRTDT